MVKSRAWQWHILGVFAALWVCVGNIAIASADDAMLYGPSDANAKQGGVLTVGSTLEPLSFEFFDQASDVINRFAGPTDEGLVWVDSSSVIHPLLAENWEISPDNKTFTFSSGKGSSFTRNTLSAEDVEYSLDFVRDPKNGSAGAGDYGTVASVDVVDPQTVRINLTEPNSAFLITLAARWGFVLPKGYYETPTQGRTQRRQRRYLSLHAAGVSGQQLPPAGAQFDQRAAGIAVPRRCDILLRAQQRQPARGPVQRAGLHRRPGAAAGCRSTVRGEEPHDRARALTERQGARPATELRSVLGHSCASGGCACDRQERDHGCRYRRQIWSGGGHDFAGHAGEVGSAARRVALPGNEPGQGQAAPD